MISSLRTSNEFTINLPQKSAVFPDVSYNLIIAITLSCLANNIDSDKLRIQAKINERNQS